MTHVELAGKNAFITGAGSGIGRGIAIALARKGAKVFLAGRRQQELDQTTSLIGATGHAATAIVTDVTNEQSVIAAIAQINRLDIAVNAAGTIATGAMEDMEEQAFSRLFETNVKGLWLVMKHEIRAMKRHGSGVIINIGSNIGARIVRPGMGAYAASKAAVSSLTRTAALEAIGHGIRINCLCPGPIDTPLSIRPGEDRAARDARVALTNPSKRVGSVEEVAETALWLASDNASYIVGQDIIVDGGASI